MFTIKDFVVEDKSMLYKIPIFPIQDEDDYLHEYMDSDIGSCISTLGIQAIIGQGIFRMGDSSVTFIVTDTGISGDAAMSAMKTYAQGFVAIAEKALPEMSEDYKKFYEFMIADFKTNGISMPVYGKL